jgi:hypothetical protein
MRLKTLIVAVAVGVVSSGDARPGGEKKTEQDQKEKKLGAAFPRLTQFNTDRLPSHKPPWKMRPHVGDWLQFRVAFELKEEEFLRDLKIEMGATARSTRES